jgi:hypothetical protein
MTEEEELKNAYWVLSLTPGVSMDEVERRYKRLAMAWHPDRFGSTEQKKSAEEEFTCINCAVDVLSAHFKDGHNPNGPCICNSKIANTQSAAHRRSYCDEDPEEVTRKTEQDERVAQELREREKKQQVIKLAAAALAVSDEQLRWKVAACLAAAWIILTLVNLAITNSHPSWYS